MSKTRSKLRVLAAAMALALAANAIAPSLAGIELLNTITSYAVGESGTVNTDRLNVRSGPGTDYDKVTVLTAGTAVTITSETTGSDGYTWYGISYSGGSGYVRYDYISIARTYSIQDAAFETYMTSQGFPESYKNGLRGLHESYPNWVFTAQQTGLDWSTVVSEESKIGKNLVDTASISSWKSLQTGAFDWAANYWPGFDGDSWVQASTELIAYYLDPRNFLTDPYIFQFELQQYDSATQTRDGLLMLIEDTFLDSDAIVPVEGSVISGGTVIEGSVYTPGTVSALSGYTSSSSSSSSTSSSSVSGPGASSGTSSVIISPGVSTESSPGAYSVSGPYAIVSALDTLTGTIESFAGYWQQDSGLTWYYIDDSGSSLKDGWYWLDGNSDGISECYYFYADGSLAVSCEIDGYTVDSDGRWTVNGAVQTKSSGISPSSSASVSTVSGELKKVPYADIIMYAASESGISPYVIAATILQEQGSGTSELISGDNANYPGYYNFFNINAYEQNGLTATQAGLAYAYEMGWSTIEKSIIGGATEYSSNYVANGQDTYYLKKFNVQGDNLYNHQYMTHVLAAASEGAKVSAAYSDALKATALEFKIPVYSNMPDTACALPTGDGNPNNKLSSLSVDGYTITPTFSMDTEEYSLIVDGGVSTVNITAAVIDSGASVSGAGQVSLGVGLNQISVVVTAANGSQRTYSIGITRRDDGTASSTDTVTTTPTATSTETVSSESYGPGGSNVTDVTPTLSSSPVSGVESVVTTVEDTSGGSGPDGSGGSVVIGQGPQ